MAVRFDLTGTRVTGPEVVIAQLAVNPWVGGAHYAAAVDGTVLFFRGRFLEPERRLVWVERDGKTVAGGMSGTRPSQPRISPDGTRGVFTALSADGDNEILLADLTRGTSVRLSADPGDDFTPAWTHDGHGEPRRCCRTPRARSSSARCRLPVCWRTQWPSSMLKMPGARPLQE